MLDNWEEVNTDFQYNAHRCKELVNVPLSECVSEIAPKLHDSCNCN